MLKKIIYSIAHHRHPWRTLKFDELAEIYASMSLRSFGFSIIGIFVPVFLYKNGISLQEIFFFYTFFFFSRIPISYGASFVIGRIGPKHTIALSTLLTIGFLGQLLTFDEVRWPLLFMAIWLSVANGLFFMAYHTDFSKVKSSAHGGKELGWLFIFERAGGAIGPVIGGLVANYISPLASIVFAIVVMGGSLIPLFMTNEPVRLHQKIRFRGFKWNRHIRSFVALGALNIDNVASQVMWPLLVAVFIFVDDTYAKLGTVMGITMALSLASAYQFGKIIDKKGGLPLMNYGVLLNTTLHAVRPLVSASGGAIATMVLNEPITLAYRMPLTKAYYDDIDTEEGYRIVYIAVSEMVVAVYKGLYCLGLFIACYFFDPITVLRMSFYVVAILATSVVVQRYSSLQKGVQ